MYGNKEHGSVVALKKNMIYQELLAEFEKVLAEAESSMHEWENKEGNNYYYYSGSVDAMDTAIAILKTMHKRGNL